MTNLPAERVTARPPLRREARGKVMAGVAAGLAEHLGVRLAYVRAAFVITALFSGAGAIAYGILWIMLPRSAPTVEAAAGLEAASRAGMRPREAQTQSDPGLMIAAGMLILGLLWLFVSGAAVPPGLFWPLVLGGVGVVVIWLQVDERIDVPASERQGWWMRFTRGGGVMSIVRLIGGMLMVGFGTSWILASQVGLSQLPVVFGSAVLLLAGLLVVSAPWLYRQRGRVRRADADRVRAEARADMAAHLHDSVLQTLALIQRQAHRPATVAQLARRQERELRSWLYGEQVRAESLRAALADLVADVEAKFPVDVEVVTVGDAEMDDRIEALILATGEAVTNAAKHSGADRIDVYAEADDDVVEVFIRDRGKGFDPNTVSEDRMGVRQSIRARMERHGGTATIRSEEGYGTEVKLGVGG